MQEQVVGRLPVSLGKDAAGMLLEFKGELERERGVKVSYGQAVAEALVIAMRERAVQVAESWPADGYDYEDDESPFAPADH